MAFEFDFQNEMPLPDLARIPFLLGQREAGPHSYPEDCDCDAGHI